MSAWALAAAVFAAVLCGAVCSVLFPSYLRKYPALPVSAFAMLAAVLFLSALAAGEGFFASGPRFTGSGWGAVTFIGVSSGVVLGLWLALRSVDREIVGPGKYRGAGSRGRMPAAACPGEAHPGASGAVADSRVRETRRRVCLTSPEGC